MPSADKLIEKMRNQPNGIRMSEADKFCEPTATDWTGRRALTVSI